MGKLRRGPDGKDNTPTYEVGRGRPPVASRWKPGQSGNPKGRPKKAGPTMGEMMAKVLTEHVVVLENGERLSMRKFEVVIRQAVARAVSGKPGAVKELLALCATAGDDFLAQPLMQQPALAYPPVSFNVNFVESRFKKHDPDPDPESDPGTQG